jgi:hypothetical protein
VRLVALLGFLESERRLHCRVSVDHSLGRLELRKESITHKTDLCLTVMTANSGTVLGVVIDTPAVWDVLHRCAINHQSNRASLTPSVCVCAAIM